MKQRANTRIVGPYLVRELFHGGHWLHAGGRAVGVFVADAVKARASGAHTLIVRYLVEGRLQEWRMPLAEVEACQVIRFSGEQYRVPADLLEETTPSVPPGVFPLAWGDAA